MSAIDDAAVLYLALNGWGEPITCRHIPAEDNLDTCDRDDIVAISSEDGSPLCTEHAKAEHGEIVHILQRTVLEEIKRRRDAHFGAEIVRCQDANLALHWQDDKPDNHTKHVKGCGTQRRGCMPECSEYDPKFDYVEGDPKP